MRKSFFNQKFPVITSLINFEDSIEKINDRVILSALQGAGGIAIQLSALPPEQRTIDNYKKLMASAPELPFMFIAYRNDKWFGEDDDGRQKFLLDAADAGAEVIDVMGDLYDPEPFELAVKPDAIVKQMALIEKIHAKGAKVIMSSHMKQSRSPEEIMAHLKEQSSRGADILKIVTQVDTETDFLEAIKTTMLLKKELDKPFVQLSSGAYSRLQRFVSSKLGLAITFAVQTETLTSQPTIQQFRDVLENIHWPLETDN